MLVEMEFSRSLAKFTVVFLFSCFSFTSTGSESSFESYMEFQIEITPQMLGILINWLIEVHLKFDFMQETLFFMVTILDQFLFQVNSKKNEMQLVALTALLLTSKYDEFWHPKVNICIQ